MGAQFLYVKFRIRRNDHHRPDFFTQTLIGNAKYDTFNNAVMFEKCQGCVYPTPPVAPKNESVLLAVFT